MKDDHWSLVPSVRRELWQADWGEIGKQLLAFAVFRARMYHWRTGGVHLLPRGIELQDIVQDVIDKTLRGQRRWDPDKGPLVPWLIDQIKSEVDALAKSAAHRREEPLEPDWQLVEVADGAEERAALRADPSLDRPKDPETALTESEASAFAEKRVAELFEAINGDQELQAVVQAIMDGSESQPRHLAQYIGISIEETNNRLKRLRRRALAITKDPQNGQAKGT